MEKLLNFILNFLNDNLGFVTLIVGIIAYLIYLKKKQDQKRDAAKIILQEIRRAEDIINDYKKTGSYHFAKKIIATNSWSKNIHLFVGDLDNDELDRISDLYSTGEYLDKLVSEISNITLESEIESAKKMMEIQIQQQTQNESSNIIIPGLIPVWKGRLDEISLKMEPIYHSTIIYKLKKIAKVN